MYNKGRSSNTCSRGEPREPRREYPSLQLQQRPYPRAHLRVSVVPAFGQHGVEPELGLEAHHDVVALRQRHAWNDDSDNDSIVTPRHMKVLQSS